MNVHYRSNFKENMDLQQYTQLEPENLKQLGFDTVSIRPNPAVMRKMYRHDFFHGLNPNRAAEYTLHASALIIAEKFDIPLLKRI